MTQLSLCRCILVIVLFLPGCGRSTDLVLHDGEYVKNTEIAVDEAVNGEWIVCKDDIHVRKSEILERVDRSRAPDYALFIVIGVAIILLPVAL